MKIVLERQFAKAVKKLHPNQKADLFKAIKAVAENPAIGTAKTGDLAGMMVYKFRMVNQLTLLSYEYDEETVYFENFGSHQNFYRDLKRG